MVRVKVRIIILVGAGLLLAWIAGLLVGCGSKPSDFELASRALYERNTNALVAILVRDKGVVTNVSGFDDATLLHYSLANVPDIASSELLVQAGADVNRRDRTGATPLHILRHNILRASRNVCWLCRWTPQRMLSTGTRSARTSRRLLRASFLSSSLSISCGTSSPTQTSAARMLVIGSGSTRPYRST